MIAQIILNEKPTGVVELGFNVNAQDVTDNELALYKLLKEVCIKFIKDGKAHIAKETSYEFSIPIKHLKPPSYDTTLSKSNSTFWNWN